MDNKDLYKRTVLLNRKRKELDINSYKIDMALLLQDYNWLCQEFCHQLGQSSKEYKNTPSFSQEI